MLRSIVSGPLDADKLDYLLRDSHFCGVKYGVYDIDRLISTLELQIGRTPFLVISEDGVHSLEQFVLAKYYMTTQVYRHRVRLITDQMITRGLTLGIEIDGFDWLRALYSYEPGEQHCKLWTSYDDAEIFHRLSGRGGFAADMFSRLSRRQLHKRAFRVDLSQLSTHARLALRAPLSRYRRGLELRVASLLDANPDFVIGHRYSVQSQREADRESVGKVQVRCQRGLHDSYDVSPLFMALDTQYEKSYLEFYVPNEIVPTGSRGADIENSWFDRIVQEVEDELSKHKEEEKTDEGVTSAS